MKELLEEKYNIQILEIEKIKNVYKIKTTSGLKCFKSSKYDLGQFTFIMSAIKHLMDKGFESVIPYENTVDGEGYIAYNDRYGFLSDWVDAREANFKNPIELKMCVETLSKMHLYSREFELENGEKGRDYYGKWVKKFKKRCDELLYFKAIIKDKDVQSEFDSIYLKYFDSHYKQGISSVRDLEESEYFRIMEDHRKTMGFCHHDTANHNFLISPDFNVYMIDFDYCILDSHLHDLASIIIRNLRYGNWDMELMEYIIDIYSNRITLTEEEKYLIYCFMEFPQDFWQVGLQYYVEKQPWEESIFLKRLKKTVEDSRERMEFLKGLKTSLMEV
ncbi:spore coat protein [Fervidicella metallireducens AeB]|uniref:Spore coat protein n=1 Tax=Fervidicella metallireducens AeB TaxID=1403537 RepID=A0A017RYV4_9CLOT|nr:spore coat protein [Fervidicella metallireducens AeB]